VYFRIIVVKYQVLDKTIIYNYDVGGNITSKTEYAYTKNQNPGTPIRTINYTYDTGKRYEKTANAVTTRYHLVGDRVTYETNGTDSIYYTYDANGSLLSMNLNGNEYYYIRNLQGDITGIIDSTGEQVVSYTYDTWGKLISMTGPLASTVGEKNPYRYRGYRYDRETGLYYLQSRYYNPE